MIDLKHYVGKRVVMQFTEGNGWFVCHGTPEGVSMILVKSEKGAMPVQYPVLQGELVELGSGFGVKTKDEQGNTLEIAVHQSHVLAVTVVVEKPRVLIG